jgi:hypothetical protein
MFWRMAIYFRTDLARQLPVLLNRYRPRKGRNHGEFYTEIIPSIPFLRQT